MKPPDEYDLSVGRARERKARKQRQAALDEGNHVHDVVPVARPVHDLNSVEQAVVQGQTNEPALEIIAQSAGDIAPPRQLQRLWENTTAEVPGLSQHNEQQITNNQRYTYNYNVTKNYRSDSSGTSGGGGGGTGWRGYPLLSPCCCYALLISVVVVVIFIIAALYGLMTAWSNSLGLVQSTFTSLASIVTFGYYFSSTGRESTPIITTMIHATTTMMITPTPLINRPKAVEKAISDVNEWINMPIINNGLTYNIYALVGGDADGLEGLGRLQSIWIITQQDISRLEKDLFNIFGPLHGDLTQYIQHLDTYPASTASKRQASVSLWSKLLSWLPWYQRSPHAILRDSYDASAVLYTRTIEAYHDFGHETVESIIYRLKKLREKTCDLRDQIEAHGSKIPRESSADEISQGIAAVVNHGNTLCEMFQQLGRRIKKIKDIGKDNISRKAEWDDKNEAICRFIEKTKGEGHLQELEKKIVDWVREFTKGVGELHHLDGLT